MKLAIFMLLVSLGLSVGVSAQDDEKARFGSPSGIARSSAPTQQRASQVIEIAANDIHLKINHDWVGGVDGGYWPIRINLVNRGPNCQIEFRAVPKDGSIPNDLLSGALVKKRVDARQNVENEVLLLVPGVSPNVAYVLEVHKDGKLLDNLNTSMFLANDFQFGSKDVISCAHIADGPDNLLKFTELANMCGMDAYYGHIELAGLPGNWLAFSTIDVIVISEADFEKELDDQQRIALLNWVRVGGTLIVHEAKDFSPDTTDRLDTLLNLNDAVAVSSEWLGSNADYIVAQINPIVTSQAVERTRRELSESRAIIDESKRNLTSWREDRFGWERNAFAIRGFNFGQIVGLRNNFFEGTEGDYIQLNLDIDFTTKDWAGTHGISARDGGHDFFKFVMQGIRVIPTYAYITLITLFCLLIGPVNYLYLYFKQRLTMILWTIPIIAVIGTAMLISYTTVASGFTTKSRMRSVTLLDQKQQTAVSATRIGLFPGRTPPNGLTFDSETAVYPVWPLDTHLSHGEIDWTESQKFDRSWLPARIRTQFIVQDVRNERGRVTFEGAGLDGKFINGLEWKINKAIVCDENGDAFFVESVAPGKSARFTALTEIKADEFKQIIEEQILESPVSYEDVDAGRRAAARSYYSRGYIPNRSTNYSSNVGEQQLGWLKRTQLNSAKLKPNSYIAILAESPNINLGIDTYNTVDELHVLFGFL